MAVVRKKQDDKNLKILREIVSLNGNKQCFDCNQKGPTYVNMTIGSFVCTRCSGVLRGLTPPHRVKSISMATFTTDEIDFIKQHGNELCAKTWLGLWDPKRVHSQDQRELMIDKYERKRYYLEPASPLKSITNTAQLVSSQKQQQQPSHANGASSSSNASTTGSLEENNDLAMWTPHAPISTSKQRPIYNGLTNAHSLFSSDDNNSLFNTYNNHNNTQHTPNAASATNGISLNNSKNNNNHNNINHNNTNGINLSNSHNGNSGMVNSNGLLNGFQIATNMQKQQQQQQQHVITKNSLNLQTSAATTNLENNNLFTPDADFVADFSKANIFNAMHSAPMQSVNNNKQIHLNGNSGMDNSVAKMNHINGMQNAVNGNQTNGSSNGSATTNGFSDTENFADFEHNTIYNAAAIENQNGNYFNSFSYNNTNNTTNYNNGNANNNNTQWSVWQQFPWPYAQPEQNRWSLPMSLSSTSNSLKSSGTFNSNSSINSTPSVDRYAALKDLDEQFREIKEKETNTQNVPSMANPFNAMTSSAPAQPNPFQASSPMLWSNDAATPTNGHMQNGSNSMFSTAYGNGYNGVSQQQQYQKLAGNTATFNGSMPTQNGFPQKNPFAAPVLNATTNPFL